MSKSLELVAAEDDRKNLPGCRAWLACEIRWEGWDSSEKSQHSTQGHAWLVSRPYVDRTSLCVIYLCASANAQRNLPAYSPSDNYGSWKEMPRRRVRRTSPFYHQVTAYFTGSRNSLGPELGLYSHSGKTFLRTFSSSSNQFACRLSTHACIRLCYEWLNTLPLDFQSPQYARILIWLHSILGRQLLRLICSMIIMLYYDLLYIP